MPNHPPRPSNRALRITLIYVTAAALWNLSFCLIVGIVTTDSNPINLLQSLGGWLFVLVSGILLYLVVHRDLVEVTRAEQRYRELFNASRDALVVMDDQGHYLDANPAAEALTGYTLAELRERTRRDLQPPTLREHAIEQLDRLRQAGGGVQESVILTCTGQIIPIEASVAVIELDGRQALIKAMRDIRERKEFQSALEQHAAELERRVAERTSELETKTRELERFAYSISHDLKAPLRAIAGYARLLEEQYSAQLDEEGRLFLANVRQNTRQMDQLIEDLLTYSRLERRDVVLQQINIRALLNLLTAEHSDELVARNIALTLDLPFNTMYAEPERLVLALRSLLSNAIKFTARAPNPTIRIGGSSNEREQILWIADNGIGFDMQYHDRIFEIFQRLHLPEEYSGTGVGLALVRKAVEQMGGRAWAESAVGAGATFYIALPQQGVNHESTTTNPPGGGQPHGSGSDPPRISTAQTD